MRKVFTAIIVLSISLTTFAQSEGDLDNKFYFRFGYVNPLNSYLGVENEDFNLWDEFTKRGAAFEIGSIFMLNSIPLPDGLRIGINADYLDMTANYLNEVDYDFTILMFKVAAKVGPSISFSPVEDLVFDAFFKAQVPIFGMMTNIGEDAYDELFLGWGGIGFATGFNVRWKFLMTGFEFNTVSMLLEEVDDGYYFGSFDSDEDKTPLPEIRVTFGFCF